MKRLALILMFSFSLMACSLDDDGPGRLQESAEIISTTLPDYFETGKSYDIDVVYKLPSACHTFAGFHSSRGDGENSTDIYVITITSYQADLTQCSIEADEEDLIKQAALGRLTIDAEVGTSYTFFLWKGSDEDGQAIYTEVEIPVIDPNDNEFENAD